MEQAYEIEALIAKGADSNLHIDRRLCPVLGNLSSASFSGFSFT